MRGEQPEPVRRCASSAVMTEGSGVASPIFYGRLPLRSFTMLHRLFSMYNGLANRLDIPIRKNGLNSAHEITRRIQPVFVIKGKI